LFVATSYSAIDTSDIGD